LWSLVLNAAEQTSTARALSEAQRGVAEEHFIQADFPINLSPPLCRGLEVAMAIWRIQYTDRFGRQGALYHEQQKAPSKVDAIDIIRRDLLENSGNQQTNLRKAGVDLNGYSIQGVDEVGLDEVS
jgi:hypothetical protein